MIGRNKVDPGPVNRRVQNRFPFSPNTLIHQCGITRHGAIAWHIGFYLHLARFAVDRNLVNRALCISGDQEYIKRFRRRSAHIERPVKLFGARQCAFAERAGNL